MKATTYISNPFNKVNMKKFCLNKYIYILSILIVSWIGVENVMGTNINVQVDGTTYLTGSTYDFGTINTTTSKTKIFTIQNTGTTNLTVTSTTTTGTAYGLSSSISSSYPQTVRPGQSTSVAIRQYSSSAGTLSGTLTIVNSDATVPSYVITLKGTAVSPGTTPTIASATNATNVGFKENWTALSGVDGYYVKACKISSAPTSLINQTISSWTQFPTNSELTCSTPFCANHNAATTQVTGDGTFVIENSAIIPSSGCAFVQLGKIGNSSATNCSISFSTGASGGALTFPLVPSAGTLTLSIAGTTSSSANYFSVLKSTDGGKTFSTLGNLTNTTATPATVSMTINEPNPCILKLLSIKSNYMRVYSINLTNYVDCSTPIQVAGASTNNYTFTTLDPNTTYYYSVASYTGANISNYSTLVNTTTQILTLPNPPTLNAATKIGATTFTCNWTAPTVIGDAAYTYTLEYSTTSDFSSGVSDITSISSGTTTYTITGLTQSTPYYYRVKAVNASGSGAYSAASSVTTLAGKNLTLTITPTGSGTVNANGTILSANGTYVFTQDSDVVLKAIPVTGYGFLRWVINDTRYADNPYTINMSDNMTVTAQFGTANCKTYNFDAWTSDTLSTSNVTKSFTASGKIWSIIGSKLNTSATYSNSGNNSICLASTSSSSTYGSLITPTVARPISLNFNARMYKTTSYSGTIQVYMSTDGGSTYSPIDTIAIPIGTTWQPISESISTTSTNVKFKITNTTGIGSTSNNIVIDDIYICEGPDATPPVLTFNPVMDSINVLINSTLTITSDKKLYYYTSSGTYVALDNAALSDASVLSRILSLTKVSNGSDIAFTATISSDGKTISIVPTSNLAYSTQYKLSIKYVADANQNMLTSTLYTKFTTKGIPEPRISVKDNRGHASYANGSSYNVGTVISGSPISAIFKIYNTGSDTLKISSANITGSSYYSIGAISKSNIGYGDSASVTVTFAPTAVAAVGVYSGQIAIASNDLTNTPYYINITGMKATFVLPYTYQSGCTSPVVSSTELTHDYSSITDIPAQIQIGNLSTSSAVTTANFNPSYSLFHAEGNCIADGNSALRVGSSKKSLVLNVDSCGQITFKWTASGYRKVSVTDALGNVYLQSSTWLEGGNCYTNSVVINSCTKGKIMISFEASDSTILTTLYYLNITKCSAELKSSAKDIVKYSFGITGEKVRIYDNYIFVTLPSTYAGSLSSLVAKTIEVSPKATVAITTTGDNFGDSTVTYTVTAEDGTTKQYTVSLEISTTHSNYYANSINVTVDMKEKDKTLSVLEISNNTCTVPSSGTGSDYTIYFLNQKSKPVGGYKISGLSKLCVGSIATYTLSNATKSNNPSYKWSLAGAGKSQFTIVGDTTSPTLTVQAPTTITGSVALELVISVGFDADSCQWTKGGDTINIQVTKTAPDPATTIDGECLDGNGYLTLTAHGAGASATTYNWNFTPSTTKISSQNDSSIVLNIGSSVNDISATINTQNGCGITKGTKTFPIDYATAATTWTGKTSTDWNTSSNWTARVPKSCTNVTIPDVSISGVAYPTISATGECNYITFEPGGAVLGLQNLTYNKAFVEIELQRNKWYTLTAPLKNMYSGDYYFSGGAPVTYMRLFDTVNPDSASSYTYTGTWTKHLPR